MPSSPTAKQTEIPHETRGLSITTAADLLSHPMRWRILDEITKETGGLPVAEIARRLGEPSNRVSKQITPLRAAGVLVVGFGRLYQVAPQYLREGRSVDLGVAILRFERPPGGESAPSRG